MITSEKYTDFVKQTFSFLENEFDYEIGTININGTIFYDVEYNKKNTIISISLETLENYIKIIIFKSENGIRSDYYDKTKTIHLNQLTKEIIPTLKKIDLQQNQIYFEKVRAETEIEKSILKGAKELRICLNSMK